VISEITGVDSLYEISDIIWNRIIPLSPTPKKKEKVGRPRMNDRKVMSAMISNFGIPLTSSMSIGIGSNNNVTNPNQQYLFL
jgi:hypothetical protein